MTRKLFGRVKGFSYFTEEKWVGKVIGIDASRNRSGGAIDHILGLISGCNPLAYGIREVHIWSYKLLLDKLPEFPWLVKHNPPELERSLVRQVLWQYYSLPRELHKFACDILFSSDAGTVYLNHPMVVFSQDALSYEKGMMKHFGLSWDRLRLILLLFVQNRSMRKASGVIFLTNYAADLVEKYVGRLNKRAIIPHGIDKKFHKSKPRPWPDGCDKMIRCVYVSTIAMYKNQWVVVKAIKSLVDRGYNLKLILAGGGTGKAMRLLDREIQISDPNLNFVEKMGHVPHEKLPEVLGASDMFIFASSCETISITLLEGMVSGLPIACSNRGPMPEVLRDGGVYFDPENALSIANAVKSIIEDEKLRESITMRSRALGNQYSWERCSKETWSFLIEAAESAESTV